ncbi:alpha/beta fold hydrolase [Thalassotalea marina]|uniref:Hydrolase n=1 Tax=Thalassotalea marina TaxID=1673741 RepID=A0A919ENS4_9GAMM|nr:alpha/beta hydrolase [Thalassotalea marina]GHG02679.1 hydrolase [Thalassotalea marina]
MLDREFVSKRDGFSLTGIEKGAGDSPILFLHGWLDNAASFIPVFEHLNDQHVVAIDWPGHGHSSHRGQDAHYHFYDYVYDLLSLYAEQGWQQLHIVAHSMGGMIACAFAAAFPEKVKSLTLIDSIGFIVAEANKTTEQLREGMLSRVKLLDKKKPVHKTIDSAIQARMIVSDLNQPSAALLCQRGIVAVEGGYTWRADSRLRNVSPYRLTLDQAMQLVNDINVPVQLIYGDKGLKMVKNAMELFLPKYKDIAIHQLSGGHHVHMEQADKTATLIKQFVHLTDEKQA